MFFWCDNHRSVEGVFKTSEVASPMSSYPFELLPIESWASVPRAGGGYATRGLMTLRRDPTTTDSDFGDNFVPHSQEDTCLFGCLSAVSRAYPIVKHMSFSKFDATEGVDHRRVLVGGGTPAFRSSHALAVVEENTWFLELAIHVSAVSWESWEILFVLVYYVGQD